MTITKFKCIGSEIATLMEVIVFTWIFLLGTTWKDGVEEIQILEDEIWG